MQTNETVSTMLVSPTYGRVSFDAVFHTDHSSNVTLTTHPVQSGASAADHAYVEPDEVTLEIGMTDCAVDAQTNRSVNTYALLRSIMEAREPVTLVTRLKSYPNMVITSLSVPDDYTTMHALRASVYLTQIVVVEVSVVSIQDLTTSSKSGASSGSSSSKSSSSSAKTSSKKTTTKSTTQSNKSVLKKAADALGL